MITLYSRFWKAATLLKISLDKQSSKVLFGRETLICLQFDNDLICYLKKKKKKAEWRQMSNSPLLVSVCFSCKVALSS